MGSLPRDLLLCDDLRLDVGSSSGVEDGEEAEEDEEELQSRERDGKKRRRTRKKRAFRLRGNGHRGAPNLLLLQNKRRRIGFQGHLSLGDLVGDQKKFWASLQHTHDWSRRLHDQKDNELEWDYGDVTGSSSSSGGSGVRCLSVGGCSLNRDSIWTFNDFMERYNQLYASLNQIQDLVFSSPHSSLGQAAGGSSADSQVLHEALRNHLEGIRGEYERFVRASSLLAEEFTDLWDEVMCRVELLAAKWEILMARSSASKAAVEEANPDHFHSDIEQDVRGLRKWLKEMEGKILPLRFRTKWSREAIEEKMKEIQVILNDIESHGRIVKSVLRLCEDLRKGEGELSPRVVSQGSKASYYDVDRAFRIAKGLEDRWHGVWLRSLEWHYFLEKLAWDSGKNGGGGEEEEGEDFFISNDEGGGRQRRKEVDKHSSAPASLLSPLSCGFESEDEPRCKVRKLTGLLRDHHLSSSPSSTLLRTKRRKTTSEYYARRCNSEAKQHPEEKDSVRKLSTLSQDEDSTKHDEDPGQSLEKTWSRVLEAAAALEENSSKSSSTRKTLKVSRKKSSPIMNNDASQPPLPSPPNKEPLEQGPKTPRKTIPNCATYFFQHVSEDERPSSNSMKSMNNTMKSINNTSKTDILSSKRLPGIHSSSSRRHIKKDPYDRSETEPETEDDPLAYSDASNSDFLESSNWLEEFQSDGNIELMVEDPSSLLGEEEQQSKKAANGSNPFLKEDIQELVVQAEKLVQSSPPEVEKKRSSAFSNEYRRFRRSRRSLSTLMPPVGDGCEASGEATTSDSDLSEAEIVEIIDSHCSSSSTGGSSAEESSCFSSSLSSSHDQTLISGSTNALDAVSSIPHLSSRKYRRRSGAPLSASESHLVYSFKKSVSLHNSASKSRSVASFYGSNGSFGGVVKRRKGSSGGAGLSHKKFALPCMPPAGGRRGSLEGSRHDESGSLDNGCTPPRGDDCNRESGGNGGEAPKAIEDGGKKSLQISPRSNESEEDFWDQEHYLSEHNYDEAIDEDTAYRVLNFGDDYSVYINSMSDGLSSSLQQTSANGGSSSYHAGGSSGATQAPKQQRRKTRRNPQWREDRKDSMSESEVEDVKRVLNTSKDKFQDVSATFEAYLGTQPENVLLEDYFNLKKTCQENMSCLALLMEPIFNESDSATLKKKGRELKGLLQKWDGLLRGIIARIQLTRSLSDLEDGMCRLEGSLGEVQSSVTSGSHDKISSAQELKERIAGYKESKESLRELKAELFKANLGVHNFLAELVLSRKESPGGLPASSPGSPGSTDGGLRELCEDRLSERLKERMLKLYALWEDVFHLTNSRSLECESTLAKLTELEEESRKLLGYNNVPSNKQIPGYYSSSSKPRNDEDEDSGISGSSTESELAQKERLLSRIRSLARELEQSLSPECGLLKEISHNLEVVVDSTASVAGRLSSSNNVDDEGRGCDGEEDMMTSRIGSSGIASPESGGRMQETRLRSNRRWRSRVLRTAVPMQIGLLLMMFLSWAMEPTCCDSSNTFFLAPQLRYVNGPPPI